MAAEQGSRTIENTFSRYGPLTRRLREFASTRFPQDWDPDLLAQLIDKRFLDDPDSQKNTWFNLETVDEGYVAQLIVRYGRGMIPDFIYQIDGNPSRRRITTSRQQSPALFVRCSYEGAGAGHTFNLRSVSIRPVGMSPELDINSDWSYPAAEIAIPSLDQLTADFLRQHGDLEVRAADSEGKVLIATRDQDPITVPVLWDMSRVG